MQNGEPNIYAAIATLRNGHSQLQWSRVQMFLAFNTLALPIVFGATQSALVKGLLGLMGLVIHGALLTSSVRAEEWIDYWDSRLRELENLDQVPGGINPASRVLVFSSPDFMSQRNSGWASRTTFRVIGIFFILVWLGVSVRYLLGA